MLKLSIILVLILQLSCISSQTKKCRALVLEGGADKGAYEAGAIHSLVNTLALEDVAYDVVSGVSVGALNAGAVSIFGIGDEKNMADFLVDLWRTVTKEQIYQEWPGGLDYALFFRESLFDTSPLRNLLAQKLNTTIKRNVTVGTCNANTGEFTRIKWDNMSNADVITSILASSAMPVLFPSIKMGNDTFIDGGSIMNLDVGGAVERCKEIVGNEADIIIDVILCSGKKLEDIDQSQDKTLQMLERYLQIGSYSKSLDDIIHAQDDYPDIKWRYVIIPSQTLPSGIFPLAFNAVQEEEMIQLGMSDAKTVIAKGAEESMNEVYRRIQDLKMITKLNSTKINNTTQKNPTIKNFINKVKYLQ